MQLPLDDYGQRVVDLNKEEFLVQDWSGNNFSRLFLRHSHPLRCILAADSVLSDGLDQWLRYRYNNDINLVNR